MYPLGGTGSEQVVLVIGDFNIMYPAVKCHITKKHQRAKKEDKWPQKKLRAS